MRRLPSVGSIALTVGFVALLLGGVCGDAAVENPGVHSVRACLVAVTLLLMSLLTALAVGERVLIAVDPTDDRIRSATGTDRLILAASVGWFVLTAIWQALAFAGQFRPVPVLLVGCGAWFVWGCGGDGGRSGLQLALAFPWRRGLILIWRRPLFRAPLITAVAVVLWAGVWSFAPVFEWDSEMYHLPAARALWLTGGWPSGFENPYQHVPGAAYLWFAVGLAAGAPAFPAIWMFCLAVHTSWLAGGLANRVVGRHAAIWTVFVYWSGSIVFGVATTPRVEPFHSLAFLTALTLGQSWWGRRAPPLAAVSRFAPQSPTLPPGESPSVRDSHASADRSDLPTNRARDFAHPCGRATVLGLCAGLCAATKYQGLLSSVCIVACVGWWALRSSDGSVRERWHTRFWLVGTTCLVVLLVAGPWYIRNAARYGDPLFPVLRGVPFVDASPADAERRLVATPAISVERVANDSRAPTSHSLVAGFVEMVREGGRRAVQAVVDTGLMFAFPSRYEGMPHHAPHYLFLVLPALVLLPARDRRSLPWVGLGLGYHLVLFVLTPGIRYDFPIFALFSLGVGELLAVATLRRDWRLFPPGAITFFLAFVAIFPLFRIVLLPTLLAAALGFRDEVTFLDRVSPGYHTLLREIDAQTPPESVLLMCWESRGDRLRRRVWIDPHGNHFDRLLAEAGSAERTALWLRDHGVTHVLVNARKLDFEVAGGRIPPSTRDRYRELQSTLTAHGWTPILTEGPLTVFRLDPPPR